MLKKNTRSLIITLTLIVALFAEGLLFAKESAAYDHTQGLSNGMEQVVSIMRGLLFAPISSVRTIVIQT